MNAEPEVRSWLDARNIPYETIRHSQVFSSIDEAKALGIEADEVGKSLVVRQTHEGNLALVVIPGGHKLSSKKIQKLFGSKHARLATESELEQDLPQFELGAVPPLSGLVNIPVYIDRRLVDHDTILFNAGSHTESVKMTIHDFINVADASVVDVVEEDAA